LFPVEWWASTGILLFLYRSGCGSDTTAVADAGLVFNGRWGLDGGCVVGGRGFGLLWRVGGWIVGVGNGVRGSVCCYCCCCYNTYSSAIFPMERDEEDLLVVVVVVVVTVVPGGFPCACGGG
jgi:hypothetical protein